MVQKYSNMSLIYEFPHESALLKAFSEFSHPYKRGKRYQSRGTVLLSEYETAFLNLISDDEDLEDL